MDQYTTSVNEELYNVDGLINKTFCLWHVVKVENVYRHLKEEHFVYLN